MAAKKDKTGIDAVRADIQSLSQAFWSLRDAMLTDAAVSQSEKRVQPAAADGASWIAPDDSDIDAGASLLAALGQPQRLRIAMMLAEQPAPVARMVEELGLKTTGAAYHHLNVLMNAGVVEQPQRGTYAIAAGASAQVHAVWAALFGAAESEKPKKKKKD